MKRYQPSVRAIFLANDHRTLQCNAIRLLFMYVYVYYQTIALKSTHKIDSLVCVYGVALYRPQDDEVPGVLSLAYYGVSAYSVW